MKICNERWMRERERGETRALAIDQYQPIIFLLISYFSTISCAFFALAKRQHIFHSRFSAVIVRRADDCSIEKYCCWIAQFAVVVVFFVALAMDARNIYFNRHVNFKLMNTKQIRSCVGTCNRNRIACELMCCRLAVAAMCGFCESVNIFSQLIFISVFGIFACGINFVAPFLVFGNIQAKILLAAVIQRRARSRK